MIQCINEDTKSEGRLLGMALSTLDALDELVKLKNREV